jgi:hypothetical protein
VIRAQTALEGLEGRRWRERVIDGRALQMRLRRQKKRRGRTCPHFPPKQNDLDPQGGRRSDVGCESKKSRVAGVGRHGRCVGQDVDSGLRPEVQSVEDVVNDGYERPCTHNSSALRIVQLQMTEDDRVMRDPEKLYQQTNLFL